MKIIKKHNMDEEILTKVLGWKWMAFTGRPVRGASVYDDKQRVRQLMSPKQLKDPKWIKHFEEHDGCEADGTEQLAYCYGSSCGPATPPRIYIMVDAFWENEEDD